MLPPETCEFCERALELTFHHLIPKKLHNRRYVQQRFDKETLQTHGLYLCKDCHKTVHQLLDHKQLAFHYNEKEKLLQHPQVQRFVRWVSKQQKRVKR